MGSRRADVRFRKKIAANPIRLSKNGHKWLVVTLLAYTTELASCSMPEMQAIVIAIVNDFRMTVIDYNRSPANRTSACILPIITTNLRKLIETAPLTVTVP